MGHVHMQIWGIFATVFPDDGLFQQDNVSDHTADVIRGGQ